MFLCPLKYVLVLEHLYYNFSIVGPTKSFVILECLAYMTTYNVHSYMIGQIWTVKILL